jgi:hypothetical protein
MTDLFALRSPQGRRRPTEVPKGHDRNRTACPTAICPVTCKGSPYTNSWPALDWNRKTTIMVPYLLRRNCPWPRT